MAGPRWPFSLFFCRSITSDFKCKRWHLTRNCVHSNKGKRDTCHIHINEACGVCLFCFPPLAAMIQPSPDSLLFQGNAMEVMHCFLSLILLSHSFYHPHTLSHTDTHTYTYTHSLCPSPGFHRSKNVFETKTREAGNRDNSRSLAWLCVYTIDILCKCVCVCFASGDTWLYWERGGFSWNCGYVLK